MLHWNRRQLERRTIYQQVPYLGTALVACSCFIGQAAIASAQIKDVPPGPSQPQTRPEEVNPTPPTQDVPERDLVARIVNLENRQMTVMDKDQEEKYTVTIAKDARVTLNRKPAKVSELKPNDFVRLTLDPANPKSATVVAAARVIKDTPPSEATIKTPRPLPMPKGKTTGVVPRAGLGVVVSDSPGEGILVLDVQRRTPAWDADIQTGDYLLKVDAKTIITPEDFLETIRTQTPNDAVRLEVWRDGKTREGAVKLTTYEAAPDREATDDRAYIVGETHGDDTVVIKRTPGRTETLDREPDQNTVVIDRTHNETAVIERQNPAPIVVEKRQDVQVPDNYDDLATKYRELQQRFDLLEVKLRQLEDQSKKK